MTNGGETQQDKVAAYGECDRWPWFGSRWADDFSGRDCFGWFRGRRADSALRRWLESVAWAALFIWAGVVWLADAAGAIDGLRAQAASLGWQIPAHVDGWTVFFFGAGTIVLAEIVFRLVAPQFGRPTSLSYVGLIVFFGIALGGGELFWPLLLLGMGASILLGVLLGRPGLRSPWSDA